MKPKASIMNTNKDVSVLERYIQMVPRELLEVLKKSAAIKEISLDMEVAARLTAFMAEPELSADNALSKQIMRREFNDLEARA